jgi:hypothetical protein
MALGDDRAIRATYVAGRLAWDRDAQPAQDRKVAESGEG